MKCNPRIYIQPVRTTKRRLRSFCTAKMGSTEAQRKEAKPPPQFHLFKSSRLDKKYTIITPTGTRIDFGAKGYSDFTKHKDPERKQRYILRHAVNQDHSPSGIYTAGWWSRWLLWNQPTINESIKNIEKNFRIKIIFHKYSR